MYVLVTLVAMMLLNLTGAYAEMPRAITASGWQEPNRPQNSVDQREETRWSCQGTCWIKYDFGRVIYTGEVWLWWRNDKKRTQYFTIETSVDGSHWEVAFDGQADIRAGGDLAPNGYTIDADIQYLRITGMGNSFNNWNSLVEVEFVHPLDENQSGTFIPWTEAVSASNVVDGNIPQYAEDGNLKTFWTGGANSFIEFELDDIYPIVRVEVAWMNGDTRIQKYAIEVSEDGSNWTRAIEDTSTGKTKDYESNVFGSPQMAKFVRIINNGGNNSKIAASKVKISITEVSIYANLSGSD